VGGADGRTLRLDEAVAVTVVVVAELAKSLSSYSASNPRIGAFSGIGDRSPTTDPIPVVVVVVVGYAGGSLFGDDGSRGAGFLSELVIVILGRPRSPIIMLPVAISGCIGGDCMAPFNEAVVPVAVAEDGADRCDIEDLDRWIEGLVLRDTEDLDTLVFVVVLLMIEAESSGRIPWADLWSPRYSSTVSDFLERCFRLNLANRLPNFRIAELDPFIIDFFFFFSLDPSLSLSLSAPVLPESLFSSSSPSTPGIFSFSNFSKSLNFRNFLARHRHNPMVPKMDKTRITAKTATMTGS
jgi:hypothetical protein